MVMYENKSSISVKNVHMFVGFGILSKILGTYYVSITVLVRHFSIF